MQGSKFARSLNQVERTLRSTSLNSGSSKKASYLACRYMPFGQQTSTLSVPDGIGSNITTRDYLGSYDIVTPANGQLDIQILPFIPMQMSVFPSANGSSATVNGKTVTRAADTGPIPFSPDTMASFRHQADQPTSTNYVSSGRVVTVGFRLFYTGPASTCSGVVQADNFPIQVDTAAANNTTPLKVFGVNGVAGPDVTNIKLLIIDMPNASVPPNKNSVIIRPEAGLIGVLKRKVRAEAHQFKSFHETGLGLVSQENNVSIEKGGPLYAGFSGDGESSWPYVTLVDDDFEVTRIRISGANMSYRLEVMTCVQFIHHPTFPLIALAAPAGPSNPAILEADDKINASMPVANTLAAPTTPTRRPARRSNNTQSNGARNPVPRGNGNNTKTQNNRRRPRRRANRQGNK